MAGKRKSEESTEKKVDITKFGTFFSDENMYTLWCVFDDAIETHLGNVCKTCRDNALTNMHHSKSSLETLRDAIKVLELYGSVLEARINFDEATKDANRLTRD